MSGKTHRAIFIDRDGTINEEAGYINHIDRFRLLPRAVEAIRLINGSPFKAVIVTNQSGVARGYFTEDLVREVHRVLEAELAEGGAKVDGIYYCPHHPDGKIAAYREACGCRKPRPGLIHRAAEELHLDIAQSYLVGDKSSDIELARSIGMKGILVLTGYGKGDVEQFGPTWTDMEKPHYIAEDLFDAVEWILDVEEASA